MKTLALTLVIILFAQFAIAQEVEPEQNSKNNNSQEIKTLFGKNKKTGGYGGFSFGFADIDGLNALTVGGKGGVIIGQHLTIGLAGKGFSTDYSWETSNTTASNVISGGYGGILIEPIIAPKFPIHLSVPIVVGAGGIGSYSRYYDTANQYWRTGPFEGNAFLFCEVGGEVEFNLTRFFRMAVGASYRVSTNKTIASMTNNNLNGLSFDLVFKFGKF